MWCTDNYNDMMGTKCEYNNNQNHNGGEETKNRNTKENSKPSRKNKKKQVVILGDSLIQNLQNVNLGYTLKKNSVVEDNGVRIEKMQHQYNKKHAHKDMYLVRKLSANNNVRASTDTTRELIEDIIKVAYGGGHKEVGSRKGLGKGDSYLSDSGVSLNEDLSTSNGDLTTSNGALDDEAHLDQGLFLFIAHLVNITRAEMIIFVVRVQFRQFIQYVSVSVKEGLTSFSYLPNSHTLNAK